MKISQYLIGLYSNGLKLKELKFETLALQFKFTYEGGDNINPSVYAVLLS